MSRAASRRQRFHTVWTGPNDDEVQQDGTTLKERVPGSRWPFGPPEAHEDACNLHSTIGKNAGLFCDCAASCAD